MTTSTRSPSTLGPQGDIGRRSHGVRMGGTIAAATLALLTLGIILWLNRPFQVELASYRTSLADRTEAQRHNIRQAAKALNGVVIEPGETFSFNSVVGPRTPERGYREAPAFMERDLVKSIGGGICQVSSSVYNAAAFAGLAIIERHPHSRRVASVPPGRDATVWYGMTDFKFINSQEQPIQLSARILDHVLYIVLSGRSPTESVFTVRTVPVALPSARFAFQTVRITSFQDKQVRQEFLSLDIYER